MNVKGDEIGHATHCNFCNKEKCTVMPSKVDLLENH